MIEEIWDAICDVWEYIISFNWLEDIWDFFGTMIEGISEFSVLGLVFGIIGFGTIYLARNYMLVPFLEHMDPTEAVLWGGATYLGTFIAGYLVGKHFENT